jgi:hypothetical protein
MASVYMQRVRDFGVARAPVLNVSGVTSGTGSQSVPAGLRMPEAFAPRRHSPCTSRARYGRM